MRKLLSLAVLLMFIAVVAGPVLAVPPAELNALASYFPAKTPVFISFRTDESYIATLDEVIGRLNAAIPEADLTPLSESLDEAIEDSGIFEDGSFSSVVRPWLGEVASVAIISFDSLVNDTPADDEDVPVVIALRITDREAAESFFETAADEGYRTSTERDYTLYTPSDLNGGDPYIAIGEVVMFISNFRDALPINGNRAATLAQSTAFTDTLALLPAADYNITAVMTLGEVLGAALETSEEMMEQQPGFDQIAPLLEAYPPIVVGATILDGRSLVIDSAIPAEELLEISAEMGFATETGVLPLDPTFAERIPAGTPLVIHGRDLRGAYQQLMAQLQLQMSLLPEDAMEMSGSNPQEDLMQGLGAVRFLTQVVTRLDLEDEIVPALSGDYAVYLGPDPALADATDLSVLFEQFPLQFGFLTSVDDPAVSQGVIDGLENVFTALPDADPEIQTTVEPLDIGDAQGFAVTLVLPDLPMPVELVFGADAEVFFLGTPDAARAALNPDGGLLSDPQYQEASEYILEGSSAVLYMASAGLEPLVMLASFAGGPSAQQDAADLEGLLSLLSSSSISTAYREGIAYTRLVWTLPAE